MKVEKRAEIKDRIEKVKKNKNLTQYIMFMLFSSIAAIA